MARIYTYYDNISELAKHEKQIEMLRHWSASWAKRGWEPVVLSRKHAENHPFCAEYESRVRRLPTVNDLNYETACYLRWLAVAASGGGFMCDYDVVNYSFTPRVPAGELAIHEQNPETMQVCPSTVSGTAAGFLSMCLYFACTEPEDIDTDYKGQPHTSDMFLVQKCCEERRVIASPLVVQYGGRNWDTADLVHYSHESTIKTDRVPCIKTAREI